MGYELNRFNGEIDVEFQCSICTMVLECPVQAPCEHAFCNNCIIDWIAINQTCPLDRKQLKISDLKPSSGPFRNMWNKLDIKCDFVLHGCVASSKLENLALHVGSCEYNPNSEIVCDKGCNLTITQREYNSNNCFSHLASAQEKAIIKVRQELNDQQEDFERIVNRLKDEIRSQHEENRKINDELSRQRPLLEKLQIATSTQTAELSDTNRILLRPPKWQWCDNVNIDEKNILKLGDSVMLGPVGLFVSHYHLEPGRYNFKVMILSVDDSRGSSIGLRQKRLSVLSYYVTGGIYVLGAKIYDGPKWKVGDIIECGVWFPKNDKNNGNFIGTVYVSKNKTTIVNNPLTIIGGSELYPEIGICGKDVRLQFFQ